MTDATEAVEPMSAQEAAQLILDWVEISGEGPPTAWPTTCGCAVQVARAYLALVERERRLREALRSAVIIQGENDPDDTELAGGFCSACGASQVGAIISHTPTCWYRAALEDRT